MAPGYDASPEASTQMSLRPTPPTAQGCLRQLSGKWPGAHLGHEGERQRKAEPDASQGLTVRTRLVFGRKADRLQPGEYPFAPESPEERCPPDLQHLHGAPERLRGEADHERPRCGHRSRLVTERSKTRLCEGADDQAHTEG